MSAIPNEPSLYQASRTHMTDIKYKLRHMVRKRARLKHETKATLLNQVPVCPVRGGVELDAKYQDVALEDKFNDVIYPNIDISISLNSIFQLLCLLFEPTRLISFLPILISFGCGQLMYKGFYVTINNSWAGAFGGPVVILIAVSIITLMAPFSAVIESIKVMYKPYTPDDEREAEKVPLLSMEEMLELKSNLPWYLTEPEVQEVRFINQLVTKLWPKINHFIQEMLNEKLIKNSDLMGKVYDATNGFVSLKVTSATIGTKIPKVTGIRILKQGIAKDVIVVDVEFTFNSDVDFSVEGTLDMGYIFQRHEIELPLIAGLKSIDLKMRTRIILSPIFSSPPIVGTVNISLLEPPIINWHFSGLLRIFNVKFLKHLLIKLISSLMTDPHSITINLAEFIPSPEMIQGTPSKLIQVEIISCSNLPTNQDKHSALNLTFLKPDSFVVVEVDGEKKWTQIQRNNCDPKFNRSFSFLSSNPYRSYVKFLVYDDDVDQDVLLGQVSIPVKFWSGEGSTNSGKAFSCNLFHPIGLKHLENEKEEESTITFRVSTYKLSKDKSMIDNIQERAHDEQLISTVISVFVDSASNLNQVPLTSIRSPELRSLVRVEVGNNTEVTSIKDRTGNPIFKQLLHVAAVNPKLENIVISIIDMYWVMERRTYQLVGSKRKSVYTDWATTSREGGVIGSVEINTLDVLKSPGMKIDGTYELTGFIENGSIKMSIEVHMAKGSENVILNRRLDPSSFPDTKILLESNPSTKANDDGASMDTKGTSSTVTTTISGKKVPKKKSIINISTQDTTINVPLNI